MGEAFTPWLLSEDKAGCPKMDVKSRSTSLPQLPHQTVRKGNKMLQMSPAEPSESRTKGRAKPKCSDWRLEPTRFSSWTCLV